MLPLWVLILLGVLLLIVVALLAVCWRYVFFIVVMGFFSFLDFITGRRSF